MSDPVKHHGEFPPGRAAMGATDFFRCETFSEFEKENIEESIPERFETIVRLYPNRLAIKDKDRSLTYDQLNRRANRIARMILANLGEGSEPIAILFEHGAVVVALIAALKAGKFYVALDRSAPLERNSYILQDSGARLIVTNSQNAGLAQELSSDTRALISIDECGNSISSDNLCFSIPPNNFVNIIYTSGSTRNPKGVVSTHRNLLDSLVVLTNDLGFTVDDRSILLHTASSGLSLTVIFPSLLNGASFFAFDIKSEGISRLTSWMFKEQITVWHSTPALFRQLADSVSGQEKFQSLRLISLGGAPITRLDFDLFKNNFSSQTLLRVSMGSTEARAICSALLDHSFSFPKDGVPVGYPVKGKTVLFFDENGNEVGPGQVGEIAVKGRNLNLGYWNQPDLTEAKFLPDPNGGDERIYLTGDLGWKLPDGFVIHLGRKDSRVKIRGYRVELGEIERVLLGHPQLKDAGVVAWDQESDERYLVAYVVSREDAVPTINELYNFLREKLPDYMIPSAFMFLPSLPLTNGKLDRTALPLPDHGRPNLGEPYVAARCEAERKLIGIWQEILEIRSVGIYDNFFNLGGHSLAASRVITRVIQTFQLELPVKALFDSPTVADMAAVIMQNQTRSVNDAGLAQMLREVEAMKKKRRRSGLREPEREALAGM